MENLQIEQVTTKPLEMNFTHGGWSRIDYWIVFE